MMFKFRFTELFIIALTGNGILADAGERILTTSVRYFAQDDRGDRKSLRLPHFHCHCETSAHTGCGNP